MEAFILEELLTAGASIAWLPDTRRMENIKFNVQVSAFLHQLNSLQI